MWQVQRGRAEESMVEGESDTRGEREGKNRHGERVLKKARRRKVREQEKGEEAQSSGSSVMQAKVCAHGGE